MKRRPAFWLLTCGFIVFLGLVIFWADRDAMPGPLAVLYAFPFGDKIGHLVLVGILATLLNVSLAARRVSLAGRRVLLGSLTVAVVITLEEASQIFSRNRTFSLSDLAMSYLGIFLCRYPVLWLCRGQPTLEHRSSP